MASLASALSTVGGGSAGEAAAADAQMSKAVNATGLISVEFAHEGIDGVERRRHLVLETCPGPLMVLE